MQINFLLVIQCPPAPPTVDHSTKVYTDTHYSSTVDYTCDVGTVLNPNSTNLNPPEAAVTTQQITCVENGSWVPDIIHCRSEFCYAYVTYLHILTSALVVCF